jgi:hypothetical protein
MSKPQAKVVADLDVIDVKPVAFRFNGETHLLKPVTTKEFLKASESFAKMDAMSKSDNQVPIEEVIDVYADLISSLCDTVNRDDILNMSQAQVAALLQLIIDHVTGRVVKDEKKNPIIPNQK